MQFPAAQIALIVNGRVEGDSQVSVSSFGKIEEAGPGQLSFLANPKYEEFLYTTSASIVIINESFELKQAVKPTLIRVVDAYTAFATLLGKYQEIIQQQLTGIQQPSFIAGSASYGDNVFIGAFAYLGENVKLGKNCKIYPHVFIGNNTRIGDNCIIHPGVKIYHDTQIGNQVIIHAGTLSAVMGLVLHRRPMAALKKFPRSAMWSLAIRWKLEPMPLLTGLRSDQP